MPKAQWPTKSQITIAKGFCPRVFSILRPIMHCEDRPFSGRGIMQLIIVGAGGHGKVVLDIVRAAGVHKGAGFVDADLTLAEKTVAGLPVLGPMNVLPKLRQQRVSHAI